MQGSNAPAALSLIRAKWNTEGFFRKVAAEGVPAGLAVGAVEVFFEADGAVFIVAAEAKQHSPECIGVGLGIQRAGPLPCTFHPDV